MRIKLTACLVGLLCAGTCGVAQASNEDESLIRSQAQAYVNAFNKSDAHALAQQWSESGTLTDIDGVETDGRAAIEKLFAETFKRAGKQKLTIVVESVRFPAPDIAIEEGRASSAGSQSHYIAVHSKVDGKWPMVSVVETASRIGSPASLDSLLWLVGSWSPKVPAGAAPAIAAQISDVHMNVRTAADNKFLEADYGSQKSGTAQTSHSQVIGYDPREGSVASWYFNSDGVGYGRWVNGGTDSWVIKARNISNDGSVTWASYRIQKVDENTFVWRSFDRYAAGRRLPDTGALTMVRQ
jgi:uncharacterized protein (TIGR02246 family)